MIVFACSDMYEDSIVHIVDTNIFEEKLLDLRLLYLVFADNVEIQGWWIEYMG